MDQDPGVRQAVAFPFGPRRQQHRAHRGSLSHADGDDVRLHEPQRVQDGQAGCDRASRRVDVERDVLFGILRGQEQHLGDHQVGDAVVDRRPQEDDVLLQEPRVDVVGALPPRGLLDHHGDQYGIAHAFTPPAPCRGRLLFLATARRRCGFFSARRFSSKASLTPAMEVCFK